jgi:GNAT superfamily N-acetyltransferase
MNFKLRRAVREDLPSLVDLELGLGINNRENLERFFAKVLDVGLRSSSLFVAEVDGRVVGSISYDIIESKGKTHISGLYVHPDFRGNGIGSKLLFVVEKESKLKGMNRVGLVAIGDAESFYEKMGFKDTRDYGKWGMVKDIIH